MTSSEDLLDALNCTIYFTTPEGDYEGVLKHVFTISRMITVAKIIFLPSNKKLGTLNFMFHEVSNVKILYRPEILKENTKETSLLYYRSDIDELFNLDGDSDAESDFGLYPKVSEEEKFVMKLLPCFSKCISTDSKIIDSMNNEFNWAIKLISIEDLIGVSLEGPNISRNGILTWLCISTPPCTFLFDILALGEKSFQKGLKSILENSKIKKIFHDCRMASDCLFHMYNVRLVNVFDTQVADSLVMMQESKNCSIVKRVNSLDSCLSYYLQVPDDYLYTPLEFSFDKKSKLYHGLRPLLQSIRGTMIKNVIYLRLLKRELETALFTPLRRATDVYLQVVQNATNRELMVAPPILEELPPELLLEGIQIVRYQQHEFIPPIVSSGPPSRKLANPIKDFVECCKKFQTKQENKSLHCDNTITQKAKESEFSYINAPNEISKSSIEFSSYFLVKEYARGKNNTESANKFNIKNYMSLHQNDDCIFDHIADGFETKMAQNISMGKNTTFNDVQPVFGDDGNEDYVTCNHSIAIHEDLLNKKLQTKDVNAIEKNHLSVNECMVLNPVNSSLKTCKEMKPDKNLAITKSLTTPSGCSTMFLKEETKLNSKPYSNEDWEAFCNEMRKECLQHSSSEQNVHKSKLRFIPAGMALF